MPAIKLTYFDARGRAETVRLVLAYAGVEYEDKRVTGEEFGALKPSLAYGQLPVMTVDGKELAQSITMARYLAKEHGLCGANNFCSAQADEVVDLISDWQTAIYTSFFIKDEEEKAVKMKEVLGKTIPAGLARLEKVLAARGGQFFAGNTMTWAELHFLQFIDLAVGMSKNEKLLEDTPKLCDLDTRTRALPNIAKWLETRPKNEF